MSPSSPPDTRPPADQVLVTGASGFAGSHLIDLLRAEGTPLVAWGFRRPTPPVTGDAAVAGGRADGRPGGRPDVRWMTVDLLDAAAVQAGIEQVRPALVFHCAGAAHAGQSWATAGETLALNVRATHHLFQAIERSGLASRVLVPGSALVYRPSSEALTEEAPLGPRTPYATSKLAQELLALSVAREDGLAVFVTRSFNHIGPRQDPTFFASSFARQIARIEAGRQPPALEVGNLESRRDLTDVRDVVRAYTALVARGRPGRPYNVCSGTAYRVSEVLDRLLALARVHVDVRPDPARLRPSDVPIVLGDATRLRDDTGWRPTIPLDQTLADLLDYWRGLT